MNRVFFYDNLDEARDHVGEYGGRILEIDSGEVDNLYRWAPENYFSAQFVPAHAIKGSNIPR